MYVPVPRRLRDMPQVRRIARELAVDPLLAVGALHQVWAYCQDMDSAELQGEHALIEQDLDLPAGLFQSLERVGWAEVRATVVDILWMPDAPRKGGRPKNPRNGSETVSEGFETVSQRDRESERESDRKGERSSERGVKRSAPAPLAVAGGGTASLSPEEQAELERARRLAREAS